MCSYSKAKIDINVSSTIRNALLKILQDAPSHLIVDISGVPYMDSSGIAVFVEGLQFLRKANIRFTLAGARPPVESVFEMARLKEVFEMVADANSVVNGGRAG